MKKATFSVSYVADKVAGSSSDKSLYIFSSNSRFRAWCTSISTHPWFEQSILLVIIANCVCLALYDYVNDINPINHTLDLIDIGFAVIYTLEMVFKIVSLGFIIESGSFLRSSFWNKMDFVMVLSSWLVVAKIPGLDILRVFRVLRPLKALTVIPEMKVIVSAIVAGLPNLWNVGVLFGGFLLIMSMISVQLFQGSLQNACINTITGEVVNPGQTCIFSSSPFNGYRCPSGSTCTAFSQPNPQAGMTHYDNILGSFLLNFQVISYDNWSQYVYLVWDSVTPYTMFFYIILVVLGSFFFVSLFLVVVNDAFDKAVREEQAKLQKKKSMSQHILKGEVPSLWKLFKRKMYKLLQFGRVAAIIDHNASMASLHDSESADDSKWHLFTRRVRKFVDSNAFGRFILIAIVINTAIMASDHYPSDSEFVHQMEIANIVFNVIFLLEMVLKITGYGFARYFKDTFNRWDCLLVFLGWMDILLTYATNIGAAKFSAFKAVRSFRVIKVVRSWTSLRLLLTMLGRALSSTVYLALVIVLFIYVFALISRILFAGLMTEYYSAPRQNFDTFWSSIVTVVMSLTGTNWSTVMYNTMAVNYGGFLLGMIQYCVFTWLLCNVFIAIFMASFDSEQIVNKGSMNSMREVSIWQHAGRGFMRLRNVFALRRRNSTANGSPAALLSGLCMTSDSGVVSPRSGLSKRSRRDSAISIDSSASEEHNNNDDDLDNNSSQIIDRERVDNSQSMTLPETPREIFYSNNDSPRTLSAVYEDLYLQAEAPEDNDQQKKQAQTQPQSILEKKFSSILDHPFANALVDPEQQEQEEEILQSLATPRSAPLQPVDHKVTISQSDEKSRPTPDDHNMNMDDDDHLEYLEPIKHCFCIDFDRENSLVFLTPDNQIRIFCAKIITNKFFEAFIFFLILVSSIAIVLENPLDDPNGSLQRGLLQLDYVLTALFTIEAVLKIISLGLFFPKQSYFRSYWNVLDAFIVVVSLFSIALQNSDLKVLKLFRLGRTIRPLRLAERIPGMRLVVNSLISTFPAVRDVLAVTFLIMLVLGTIGVEMLGGRMGSCNDASITTRQECTGSYMDLGAVVDRFWIIPPANFDHIGRAMLTLFRLITQDNWTDIAFAAWDSSEVNKGPVTGASPVAMTYVVICTFIMSYFVLSIFVGVLLDVFFEMKEKSDFALQTDAQKLRVEVARAVHRHQPELYPPQSKSKIRRFLRSIAISVRLEVLVAIMIIGNTIVICLEHTRASPEFILVQDIAGHVFTWFFAFEMVVKIGGFGVEWYFRDNWCRFDFILVTLSIINLFVDIGVVGTTFRILRLAALRLFRHAREIQKLLRTLFYALPALGNVVFLLCLIFFIYACLGVQLFAKVNTPGYYGGLNTDASFQSFSRAVALLFRFATGDSWANVMYDCMIKTPQEGCNPALDNCGSAAIASAYFVSFIVLINFTFLNLFIAVVMDQFADQSENAAVTLSMLDRFARKWYEEDRQHHHYLNILQIARMMKRLGHPLAGVGRNPSIRELLAVMSKMEIQQHNGDVYYKDLLLQLLETNVCQTLEHAMSDEDKQEMKSMIQKLDAQLSSALRSTRRPDSDVVNMAVLFAAVKIQSIARGYIAKKQVQKKKAMRDSIHSPIMSMPTVTPGETPV